MRYGTRAKIPTGPDQPLVPPFMLAQHPSGFCAFDLALSDAVDEFVRYAMPPLRIHGGGALITDHWGVVAVGYGYLADREAPVEWVGVTEAFDLLLDHPYVDALMRADIEMVMDKL